MPNELEQLNQTISQALEEKRFELQKLELELDFNMQMLGRWDSKLRAKEIRLQNLAIFLKNKEVELKSLKNLK